EDAIFEYPELLQEVRDTNKLILSLAPVLNSESVSRKISHTSPTPIATMLKAHDKSLYLFAVAMRGVESKPQFVIEGAGNVTADVIGETRKLEVRDGSFSDNFEGYGVHLYKIPLNKP